MVKVKICGLTRAEDVERAIEYGADAVGFSFDRRSPRYVRWDDQREDLAMIAAPFVTTVAVYEKYTERKDTCTLVQSARFDDDPGWLTVLSDRPDRVDARPGLFSFKFPQHCSYSEAVKIMDGSISRSNVVATGIVLATRFNPLEEDEVPASALWLAAEFVRNRHYRVVMTGGLTPDNVGDVIEMVGPYAVDVCAGVESSPGVKDRVKMRDFIQAAKGGAAY